MSLTIAPSMYANHVSPRSSTGPLQTLLMSASNQPRTATFRSEQSATPTRADGAYRDLGDQALTTLLGDAKCARFISGAAGGAAHGVSATNAQALREVAINLYALTACAEPGCKALADAVAAFKQLAGEFQARPQIPLTTCSLKNDKPYRAFEALKANIDSLIRDTPGLVDVVLRHVVSDYVVDGLRAGVETRGGGQLVASDAQRVMEHGTLSDVARQVLDGQLRNALNAQTGQGLSEGIRSVLSVLELSRPMSEAPVSPDAVPTPFTPVNAAAGPANAGSGWSGMHNVGNGGGATVTTGNVTVNVPEIDYGKLADTFKLADTLKLVGIKSEGISTVAARQEQRISELERQLDAERRKGSKVIKTAQSTTQVLPDPAVPEAVAPVSRKVTKPASDPDRVVLSMGSSASNGERVNQNAVNPWIQFNRVQTKS